jgi:hypothetical protein
MRGPEDNTPIEEESGQCTASARRKMAEPRRDGAAAGGVYFCTQKGIEMPYLLSLHVSKMGVMMPLNDPPLDIFSSLPI